MASISDLIATVRERIAPGSVADATADAGYLLRIVWTIRDIEQLPQLSIPDLEAEATLTLVPGQRVYALPSDLLFLRSVRYVDAKRPLAPLTTMEEAGVDETETGETTHFFHWQRSLILYPVPATFAAGHTLRLRYRARLTEPTAASASTGLPDWCDEAVILGAIYKAHRDANEVERAQAAGREYAAALSRLSNSARDEFLTFGGTVRPLR